MSTFTFVALAAIASTPSPAADASPGPSSASASTAQPVFWLWASRPIMGWNSWDCFGAGVNEAQTLANAQYMQEKLLAHAYNLITVDIQWYEPKAHDSGYRRNAVLEMDGNGRLLPAANRFPSSKKSRSFKPLADKIHGMGLKFGVHLMRGIPRQAVNQNVRILGTDKLREGGVRAADIASKRDVCFWNGDMYGVDMSKPGAQEYYDSVFALLAAWEIDFVKVDDLSRPYHKAEIEAIRKSIDKTGRPIEFSTSPGATPVGEGSHVEMHANQWRVSDDFWDQWRLLREQFARLNAWTPYRGPGHFPDADMLPLGNIRAFQSNDAWTHFTRDEQVTMMTLWCIARSPLIVGANLPKNDDFTLKLLTNDEVLRVDQHSTNNRQMWKKGDFYAWVADDDETSTAYVALFNAPDAPPRGRRGAPAQPPVAATASTITFDLADLPVRGAIVGSAARDLWNHKYMSLGGKKVISAELMPHQSALFKIAYTKL